jgi:nucleotide-binding universal stress UspA family protein
VTKVAAIAGEIKNPSRNLPIAMIVALAAVTFVYVLVTFIMVGNVPVENLQNDIHPIYTFALTVGGKSLGIAASVLGVFTLISMANSGVLAASRFPFAMSRDELLPKVLGRIHPKFLTPTLTIFVTCLVMALAIIFLDVEKIAKLASAFMVTMFILVNACVIVLRETSVHWYQPSYRAPLYPYLQIFGIVSGVILLFFLGFTPMLAVLAIFLLGYLSFEFYGKSRAQRKGVLRMYGHRPALAFLYNRRAKTEMGNTVQTVSSLGKKSQKSVGKLIDKEANVVVALFGKEYSPEMVVETGLALAGANQMQVVHVTEVPEQTALEAVDDVTLIVKSIERRVQAMAEDKKAHFKFDSVATHEIIDTMHTISDLTHCEWMVMGWEGRASRGLLVRNPTGWLTTHLNSHFALFKDNGVRYIRKILVCLRPGRDEVLFLNVADRLAQYHRASFTLIRVLKENASDKECQDLMASSQQMLIKSKSSCDVKIIRDNQTVEAIVKTASSYDLLITGTPANENIVRSLFGSGRDKFAETASCSVLRLTVKRT